MTKEKEELFFSEIISRIREKKFSSKQSRKELARMKRDLCTKYGLKKIPTNIEILLRGKREELAELKKKLLTKPTRTISGVAPVALMTKPFPCPHAKSGEGPCAMCPGGPKSFFGEVPQSYTGREPATMRGIRNNYDSYLQMFNRLEQYVLLGHCIDKVELILMGGTFPSFPKKYQEEFVWGAFKAMNDFSRLFYRGKEFDWKNFKSFFELPVENLGDEERTKRIQRRLLRLKGKFKEGELLKEQGKNEKAKVRGVALCIETRPDYCQEKEIKEMLKLGCTRVELGVQHLDNKVLDKIKRGHKVEDSIKATKLLKDNFLKVGYHMMLGLPGSSVKKDKEILKELFEREEFKPDALKLYPCMVVKGTKLYESYKRGSYRPLKTEEAAKIIAWFKEKVPEYVRILRVQRDIPTYQTVAGVGMTNLRQYIYEKYKPKCRCIRCREPKREKVDLKKVKIKVKKYQASGGEEFFVSAEEEKKDLLLGFCRLRVFQKGKKKEAGIRELHVYGKAVSLGKREEGVQHQGLGKRLLREAEKIVKEKKIKELKVISGVGAREYYRKQGYKKKGFYMSKFFK